MIILDQLITTSFQLPANIEDLTKFVLVGREKLTSVRAEIRAIDKLNLAEEVREQKREECLLLSEALLDAEVRIGELLKEIPKATKGNQYTGKMVADTAVDNQKQLADSSVVKFKTKSEAIKDLGFSEKQAERFEALANNQDLVEQVKAEARENDDIPTRTRVLDLAKQRKKEQESPQEKEYQEYCKNMKERTEIFKAYLDAMMKLRTVKVSDLFPEMVEESFESANDIMFEINNIDEMIEKLETIKQHFVSKMRLRTVRR